MSTPTNTSVYGVSVGTKTIPAPIFLPRSPSSSDIFGTGTTGTYPLYTPWLNTSTFEQFRLVDFSTSNAQLQATWLQTNGVITLSDDAGTKVYPSPLVGNIQLLGTGGITVTANPGSQQLIIDIPGSFATIYTADSGTATPAADILNILGGSTGLTTLGSGNTISLTGTLNVGHGGTNATTFSTSGGIVYYNATSLVTSSTFKIDNSNRTTNTSQPSFSAILSSTQNDVTGDGTLYQIIFDTEQFDQNSNYNNSTGVFTAPVAGKYHFDAACFFTDLDNIVTSFEIRLVATSISLRNKVFFSAGGVPTSGTSVNIGGTISMSANDTLTVQVAVANSTKTVDVSGSNTSPFDTYVSGNLIC